MDKLYLTITLFFISSQCSLGQQALTQYFDGADTSYSNSVIMSTDSLGINTWQIGPPQKTLFNSAATSPNVIITDTINPYPANDSSSFIAKVYLGTNPFFGVFALQWKQKLDLDDDDGAIIEFLDPGNVWMNVFNNPLVYNIYGFDQSNLDTLVGGQYALTGRDTTWRDIWFCLDMSWWWSHVPLIDTLYVRFTLKSDSVNHNKEGWMMDNFNAHLTWVHTVKKHEANTYLNVYPNPSSGLVHVETEKRMEYHLIEHMELLNTSGQIIDRWNNIPTKFWFPTEKYAAGLYSLKVVTNIKTEIVPLLINK